MSTIRVQMRIVATADVTLEELAALTDETIEDVTASYENGAILEWLDLYCSERLEQHIDSVGRDSTEWEMF